MANWSDTETRELMAFRSEDQITTQFIETVKESHHWKILSSGASIVIKISYIQVFSLYHVLCLFCFMVYTQPCISTAQATPPYPALSHHQTIPYNYHTIAPLFIYHFKHSHTADQSAEKSGIP